MVVPVAVLLAALAGGAPAQEKPPQAPPPNTPDKPADKPAEPSVTVDTQDKPVAFPAQVEQVIVDVVVSDKKGVSASNLTKDDFVITEDGAPQNIVSFEAVQVPQAPSAEPKPRPRVSTNLVKEDRSGRVFVVVFDDINLSPTMSQRAKGAVGEFLKNGTREGDRVLLVSTSGSVWWSARLEQGREELLALLKRLDGRYIPDLSPERMTDYEAMRIHMFHDPQVADRVSRRYEKYGVNQKAQSQQSSTGNDLSGYDDPMVTGRATEVYFQSVTRNRLTLDLLERVMGAIGETRGRKSLILVSQGFIYDPNLDEFKRVVQASRRANAAIYFLDTRGLEGMPVYMTAQFGPALDERDIGFTFSENVEASEGSESIADDSGGFTVRNTNDLNKGITRIADDSRMYYLIGYNPTNVARDGKFRKIGVKLTPAGDRKGLQVRARKGYYAASDGKTALSPKTATGNTDPKLQAAVDSPFDRDDLPLRMTAYVFDETLMGKSQTLVAADIDIRNLSFEEKDGRSVDTLEFMMVVAHRETGEFFRYDQKMDLKLSPATRKKFEQSWVPVVRDFELKPGLYQAKIVVRDKNAQKIGTLTHEFEVGDPAQFRISTPILSDTLQPLKEGDPANKRPVPAMLARRTFTGAGGEGMIYCSIDVYGASKDPKTGMPQVAMGYVVKKASDGSTVARIDPTPIRPTTLGKLSRLVGVGLNQFEPGDYDFVLQVQDQVSGRAIEQKEAFSVGPATGAAPAAATAPPASPATADRTASPTP
jgi:VWFA-related protein